jgi:hypothetical protein
MSMQKSYSTVISHPSKADMATWHDGSIPATLEAEAGGLSGLHHEIFCQENKQKSI